MAHITIGAAVKVREGQTAGRLGISGLEGVVVDVESTRPELPPEIAHVFIGRATTKIHFSFLHVTKQCDGLALYLIGKNGDRCDGVLPANKREEFILNG